METFQALQDKIKRNKRLHLNDLIVKGEVIFNNIPTEDPQVKDQLWSNNGVLSVSSGIKQIKAEPVIEEKEEEVKPIAVKKSVKKTKTTTKTTK